MEYLLINKCQFGIISNAERTIFVELDSKKTLEQSGEEVKLVVNIKVSNYNDPFLTKMGFLLWWFRKISNMSKDDVKRAQKNMAELRKKLELSESSHKRNYHIQAAKFLTKDGIGEEISKVNVSQFTRCSIFKRKK